MPSLSLTNPTALTVITAGLHATNYSAIQTLLNGQLANDNIASGAGIATTKLALGGGTTNFLRADGAWAAPFSPLVPATTLPGSPVNGQQAILTDSLTAPTYHWLFQYDSGISDAYKWRYVGGVPAYKVNNPNTLGTGISGNYYYDPATAITVPRAGIYIPEFSVSIAHNSDGNVTSVQIFNGTTALATSLRANLWWGSLSWWAAVQTDTLTTCAASDQLRGAYNSPVATKVLQSNSMKVTPVRVA